MFKSVLISYLPPYWQDQGSMIPGLNVQIQDHLGIAAWVPAADGGVEWGPFHRLGRRLSQWLQGVVIHGW